jgi:tRNA(adenine34) deaminase
MPGKTHNNSHGKRKWSSAVTTESTHPHAGLFNKDAETIARQLASKKVSPKGPSSGMRMLTFYQSCGQESAGKSTEGARGGQEVIASKNRLADFHGNTFRLENRQQADSTP